MMYCLSIEKKLGIKSSPTAVLQYGQDEALLAILGKKIAASMRCPDDEQRAYDVGLQGLAIAERAYQQAVGYARDQFRAHRWS